ncbi:hypothetical protein AKJ51_04955, partial [candidate division MSBL1 archaeon SCGC-AAA382A20]
STCSYCKGYGEVESRQGFFAMRTTCPRCNGKGTIIDNPCAKCHGSGLIEQEGQVDIRIPPGIESGTRLRVRSGGEPSPESGDRGDLFCDIVVNEHPIFEREGANLICEVPITFSLAALGGKAEVPTIKGEKLEVDIPAGSQNGDTLRLRKRGLPAVNGRRRGPLLVKLFVEVPKKLTSEYEELLHQLAEIEGANVPEQRESFLKKLKNYVQRVTHPANKQDSD